MTRRDETRAVFHRRGNLHLPRGHRVGERYRYRSYRNPWRSVEVPCDWPVEGPSWQPEGPQDLDGATGQDDGRGGSSEHPSGRPRSSAVEGAPR